ncbi:TRAP-type C4-dicarboxylate transport system, small permease component [Pilibacter termitis]|uniref:TRAP-type C4-dicarboxylate transport system, small permease component n=1 Tax=Pilibacter termitis TaxID=263852 RepID=A0A1T4K542_9ENTE|nr:TRAP transporter small permease [Pilibacter termitis]SJZ37453.1 TRAP-type C4-dicarboxylate transport system, small permease component [Pilibacter termitis]
MKKIGEILTKIEELFVAFALAGITFLIFIQAIMRTIKMPINWGQDVALLLFPWVIFLGADLALREADFVSVDMITRYFPKAIQSFFYYLWYAMILVFLGILAVNAFPIMQANSDRMFSTLGISYNWAVVSCPVGSVLLISTILIKLYNRIVHHKKAEVLGGEF